VLDGVGLRLWRRVVDLDCLGNIQELVDVSNFELRGSDFGLVLDRSVRIDHSSSLARDG